LQYVDILFKHTYAKKEKKSENDSKM